jgi:pantoate--beta-alanine ligase
MPTAIHIARTTPALRRPLDVWRREGRRIALVPTMGALHEGHVSLVTAARRRGCKVVASIFVNPTQFGPNEDLSTYPRTFESDRRMLAEAGCGLIFAPPPSEIYPEGFATTVTVAGPAKAGLEDRFRPFHFDGVATVVAKLFAMARPDVAIFGEKDYQQLQVVMRMAADLDLAVRVVGAPTVREADGLAMSSRNRYLSPTERRQAAAMPQALLAAIAEMRAGAAPATAVDVAAGKLASAGFAVDYVEVRHATTLAPVASLTEGPARILAAAKIGATRLIDNMAV